MTRPDAEPGSPVLFADLVAELLAAEDKRRESLEARGGSIITVSGALVTLLLALAGLVTKEKTFELPPAARDRLSLAVLAFVVAALLAIATYAPQRARITDPTELSRLLPSIWERGTDFALKKATATRLQQLTTTQTANDRKARALLGACSSPGQSSKSSDALAAGRKRPTLTQGSPVRTRLIAQGRGSGTSGGRSDARRGVGSGFRRGSTCVRPPGESVVHAVRRATLEGLERLIPDPAPYLTRSRLAASVPAAHARSRQLDADYEDVIAEAVAAAENTDSAADLRARGVARAAWSATRAAREVWLATAGTRDPRELVNDAFDLLEQGAS